MVSGKKRSKRLILLPFKGEEEGDRCCLAQHNTAGWGTPGYGQRGSASASVQSKKLSKGLTLRSSTELELHTRYIHLVQKNELLGSVTDTFRF